MAGPLSDPILPPLPALPARGSAPTAAAAPQGQPVVFSPQARACLDCAVRKHALFGVLDAAALAQMHWRIADMSLAPGQTLFQPGEPGQAAYTLREGLVRLERVGDSGGRHVVRLAGRGDLVGAEALLGQSYATQAVACTPVKLCRLPRALVDELADGHPELLRALMQRWQRALDEADEWISELLSGPARWRMLRLLLKLSEHVDAEGRVWLPSRQDMGAMLGMTVETASRLVSALKREGVLQPEGSRHARIDMAALMAALRQAAAEA